MKRSLISCHPSTWISAFEGFCPKTRKIELTWELVTLPDSSQNLNRAWWWVALLHYKLVSFVTFLWCLQFWAPILSNQTKFRSLLADLAIEFVVWRVTKVRKWYGQTYCLNASWYCPISSIGNLSAMLSLKAKHYYRQWHWKSLIFQHSTCAFQALW